MLNCLGWTDKVYHKGEYVLLDEDEVSHVCILLSGCIHMLKEDEVGHLTFLSYMQPGELFGESFALRKLPRTRVSFLAARESIVLFLPLVKVMHTCDRNCQFHQLLIENMYELLSLKNLSLMQKLDVLSRDTLRDKILSYLKLQIYGTPETGASLGLEVRGNSVTLPLNKSEFAHFLNVNRTSLCRELSAMEAEGLLRVEKNCYTVLGN